MTITKSSNANNYWSGDAADATNIADGMPVYCDKTTALRFKWTLFKE